MKQYTWYAVDYPTLFELTEHKSFQCDLYALYCSVTITVNMVNPLPPEIRCERSVAVAVPGKERVKHKQIKFTFDTCLSQATLKVFIT